jgi:hypothetical protein
VSALNRRGVALRCVAQFLIFFRLTYTPDLSRESLPGARMPSLALTSGMKGFAGRISHLSLSCVPSRWVDGNYSHGAW